MHGTYNLLSDPLGCVMDTLKPATLNLSNMSMILKIYIGTRAFMKIQLYASPRASPTVSLMWKRWIDILSAISLSKYFILLVYWILPINTSKNVKNFFIEYTYVLSAAAFSKMSHFCAP